MKKPICRIFLMVFLGGGLFAQDQAAMTASPRTVKQGDAVTVHVKLNRGPSVIGRVQLWVAPEGSESLEWNGGNGIAANQTDAGDIVVSIPTDGKTGSWKVVKVTFQAINSKPVDLSVSGKTTFGVVKRETVYPTSADVEVK